MNLIHLALQHTWITLSKNWLFFLLLAAIHLATNAAFTGFVSFAFNTLFYGSHVQPETIGLIAGAPLTASLAVIITAVTFGTARPANVLNTRFLGDLVPLTIIYAWFFFIAWYCRVHLPARITWYVNHQPWITEYATVDLLTAYLPWFVILLAAAMTMLAVPAFVARRQVFRHHAMIPPIVALILSAAFLAMRDAYQDLTGQLNPYYWLPFPGYHPAGAAYDQMLFSLVELPILIPASILTTCFVASMAVAANRDRGQNPSPAGS